MCIDLLNLQLSVGRLFLVHSEELNRLWGGSQVERVWVGDAGYLGGHGLQEVERREQA